MEKLAEMALLADFYGPLLTDRQRNIWDLHYEQDFSLVEIAETENISRQAVFDLLKRTEKILLEYEEKLGLVARFATEKEKLSAIEELLARFTKIDFTSEAAWEKLQLMRENLEDIFRDI